MKEIVIFDTEYTAWEGSWQRDWSGEGEYRELVQIAAIRINPLDFTTIGEPLDIIINPSINPILSDYFVKLTGITNDMVNERGEDITTALQKFIDYSHGAIVYSFGDDCKILNENLELYKLQDKFIKFEGCDISAWAASVGINVTQPLQDGRAFTSGTFAEAIGAPFKTKAHYALNDVLSIHAAVKYLVGEKGLKNPFEQ